MFIQKLDLIERLKKEKRYDEAWKEANSAPLELSKSGDEMWFMMYYQMADILAREKKWLHALRDMGFVIHYLSGPGGITHGKFVKKLLKKLNSEGKFDDYISLCVSSVPRELESKLSELLK